MFAYPARYVTPGQFKIIIFVSYNRQVSFMCKAECNFTELFSNKCGYLLTI